MRKTLALISISLLFTFLSCKKESSLVQEDQLSLKAKTLSWPTRNSERLGSLFKDKNNVTGENWMSQIPNAVAGTTISLQDLSIPGTHNSAARFEKFGGTAKCQNQSINDQLSSGVRYFDIRLSENMNVFHGKFYQSINFKEILIDMTTFLKKNPNEFLIVHVTDENCDSKGIFTEKMHGLIQSNSKFLYENPNSYKRGTRDDFSLAKLRGKIVLLRRWDWDGDFDYRNDPLVKLTGGEKSPYAKKMKEKYQKYIDFNSSIKNYGFMVAEWGDNRERKKFNKTNFILQDLYNPAGNASTAVANKKNAIAKLLAECDVPKSTANETFINYASVSFIPGRTIFASHSKINPWLRDLFTNQTRPTGIVALDMIDKTYARSIYLTN